MGLSAPQDKSLGEESKRSKERLWRRGESEQSGADTEERVMEIHCKRREREVKA